MAYGNVTWASVALLIATGRIILQRTRRKKAEQHLEVKTSLPLAA
jgi:hypothetical protein